MNNTYKLYFGIGVALFSSSLIVHYKQYKKNEDSEDTIENLQYTYKQLQNEIQLLNFYDKTRVDFNKNNKLEKQYDEYVKQCCSKPQFNIYERYVIEANKIKPI